MDNKKLMQILLRDVSELQELVQGIKISGQCDPLVLELLHTRISGVRYMLEVVSESNPAEIKVEKDSDIVADKAPERTVPQAKPETDQVPAQNKISYSPIAQVVEVSQSPGSIAIEVGDEPQDKKAEETEPVVIEQIHEPEPVAEVDNDEVELEEEAAVAPQTFGEKFQHGKSVNDLLLEHGKTDYKYSNMPVSNLQAAIGINDRFLFTRELFEGNADRFAETVGKIDSMTSIHDAALFLRENFKWKKNDTSLKFIDLVKRRFL